MKLATVFDFNGVLLDDEHLHYACMAEVLAKRNVPLAESDYFGRYFALDDVGAFRAILTDAGKNPTEEQVRALVQEKIPVYLRRAGEARVFPGAPELLRACAAEGPVAIVSGALRHEIEIALRRMEALDTVSAIVSAEDTTACKPDPQGYRLGVEALAKLVGPAAANRAVAIEDSPGGIRAAKGAGLAAVAVLHSAPEAALRDAGADHVVPRLGDIAIHLLADVAQRVHG